MDLINNMCKYKRDKYVEKFEELEFASAQEAAAIWKSCHKTLKCDKDCPTYGDTEAFLKMKFIDHFKKVSQEHKDRIGDLWDKRCGDKKAVKK